MKKLIKYIKINFKLTYILIAINVIAVIITNLLTVIFNGKDSYALLFMGASYVPFILNGEVWRLVTASFLHDGWIHLALNMYSLYVVGGFIEQFYGAKKLFTVYILTALGASLLSVGVELFGLWNNGGVINAGSFALSVGASGAIFGMVGVLIGNKFKKNIYQPDLNIDINQLLMIVFYNLLVGFGLNLTGGTVHIDNWAHLGGLATGIVLGLIFDTVNNFYQPKWKKILEKVLIILAAIIFVASTIAQLVYISQNR